MLEIETARLRLRQFAPEDLDDLYRLYSDPEVMRYISLRTREQTQASLLGHIKHWEERGFGMWAVVHKMDNKMIGRCGLGFLDNTPEIELGYVLDKSYWGMGIGTEAALASLKFGFEELKLERSEPPPGSGGAGGVKEIVAIAHPNNIASRRIIEKLGLKYEKDARYYNTDVVYYSLCRSAYQPSEPPQV